MICIDEIPVDIIKNKHVLLRADFNLPLTSSGEVADVFRVKQGWRTVEYLAERGAKVIIISHIGRDPEESLEPVAKAMKQFGEVTFVPDITGFVAKSAVAAMQDGQILVLENLRRDPRESANDETFAKELASLAEVYVNDAFAADHREHASIVGVPKLLPHYAGLLLRDEVEHINAARAPMHPSFAILGGAKFETKAPLISLLLERYDKVFITGALANDVFKAKGMPVGVSLISKELPSAEVLANPHFVSPVDVTVESPTKQAATKKPEEVLADDKIVDIGPETLALIGPLIEEAGFILWNGPTGLYEDGYMHWTRAIAEKIAESKAQKVIGGGDTIAVIEKSALDQSKLGFLSTGGGAMLELLLKGTLPGIEALN
jgi:phosphoglycerate kinase